MTALLRYFRAERIKWRKHWVLVAIILAPLCQVGNLLLVLWFNPFLVKRFRPGFEFWIELNYLAWAMAFLPILVALICALSWDQELESKSWNHLLTQPVPRHTHFLVKGLSHLALVLLSQFLLALLLVPGGLILKSHLGLVMGYEIPWGLLLRFGGFSLAASIPLVAFHTWFSARLNGIGMSLLVGLGGTWLCSRLAGTTAWLQLTPWGLGCQVIAFFDRLNRHVPWEYIPGALLFSVILTGLGTLDFARDREPKR